MLTAESRGWASSTGSFTSPKPRINFAPGNCGGRCAWEVDARYSDLDLNDNIGIVGSATPSGDIRVGAQRIGTLGLN